MVDPLATSYPWYTPYQFAGNEVPNAIDRDGMEPAYPHPDGSYTIARDGQLAKPLTDPDGIAYLNSKTEVGGADKIWDSMTENLNNIGAIVQLGGFVASVTGSPEVGVPAMACGEGFETAGTVSGVTHDLSQGKTGSAIVKTVVAVAFKGAGKDLEKAAAKAGLSATKTIVKNGELGLLNKATDKAVDVILEGGSNKKSNTPSSTMQQDATKTPPPPPQPKIKQT